MGIVTRFTCEVFRQMLYFTHFSCVVSCGFIVRMTFKQFIKFSCWFFQNVTHIFIFTQDFFCLWFIFTWLFFKIWHFFWSLSHIMHFFISFFKIWFSCTINLFSDFSQVVHVFVFLHIMFKQFNIFLVSHLIILFTRHGVCLPECRCNFRHDVHLHWIASSLF